MKSLKALLAGLVLAATLVLLPGVPAAAHLTGCNSNGSTWVIEDSSSNGKLYGNGTSTCNHSHSTLYTKVTLQAYLSGQWVNFNSAEKTSSGTTISKQVQWSGTCNVFQNATTWRVKVRFTINGGSGGDWTVYRGQNSYHCHP